MELVYARRKDVRALTLATEVYDQKVKVARSEMLPQVAAFGAYHATNPNTYNGFKNRFGLAFSVGAMVKVPIWHKADENLRMAQVAFKEGVGTSDEVMAAQTAWLKANSEKIDAEIDVRLCDTYLSKVLGEGV